jgi:DNA-binding PadR family transcriptional regulator
MCRPTQNSTTLPEPSGPTDERIVYHLTDAGRRALQEPRQPADGTASPDHPGAAGDDDEPATERRSLTVCGRWRQHGRVPDLRMSGHWLREAGFDLGQKYEVQVGAGRLVVEAV